MSTIECRLTTTVAAINDTIATLEKEIEALSRQCDLLANRIGREEHHLGDLRRIKALSLGSS